MTAKRPILYLSVCSSDCLFEWLSGEASASFVGQKLDDLNDLCQALSGQRSKWLSAGKLARKPREKRTDGHFEAGCDLESTPLV